MKVLRVLKPVFKPAKPWPNLSVPSGAVVALQSGQVCSLSGAAGWQLCVEAGSLWVTEAGDLADHCLTSAAPYVIRGRGMVVIECLGSGVARFRVRPGVTTLPRPSRIIPIASCP